MLSESNDSGYISNDCVHIIVARVVLALAISIVQRGKDRGYTEKVENDCGDQGPGLEHKWLEVGF